MKSKILAIPSSMQKAMIGVSWHLNLPSPALEELRLLEIPFLRFDGAEECGALITSLQLSE